MNGENTEFATQNAEVNAQPEPEREETGAGREELETEKAKAALRTPDSGSEMRAHLASLYEQAAELTREIPGFDLREALRDPDFLRMTSPAVGVSVRRAWYALHGAARERQAAQHARDEAAAALRHTASRPREGERSLGGGTLSRSDPGALDGAGRAALRQRIYDAAARGEKIYP